MKNYILFVLVVLPLVLKSQSIDSSYIAARLDSLIKVTLQLSQEKKIEAADRMIIDAEKLAVQTFGKGHYWYAQVLYQRGRIFGAQSKSREAVELFEIAQAIKDSTWQNHPNRAICLIRIGTYQKNVLRDYSKAEEYFQESLRIKAKVLGKTHLEYAAILNEIGKLYPYMRKYEEAEKYHWEALTIIGKVSGKENNDYANTVFELGRLYFSTGDFVKSEEFCLEAKRIWEKTLGLNNPTLGTKYIDIADILCSMNVSLESEALYDQGKEILKRTLGAEHLDYAMGLQRIGSHYTVTLQHEKAMPFYHEAKAIREKKLSKEHPVYGESMQAVGNNFAHLGKYVEAEQHLLECLSIRGNYFGKDHELYGLTLCHLGSFYKMAKRYSDAEKVLVEARSRLMNKNYYGFANNLLASLFFTTGRYSEAATLYKEIVDNLKKIYGQNAEQTNVFQLGHAYLALGRKEDALNILSKADSINHAMLVRATQYMSIKDLALYAKKFYTRLDDQLALSYIFSPEFDGVQKLNFDNVLFSKGFLMNAHILIKKVERSNPNFADKLSTLKSLQSQLANEYTKPLGISTNSLYLEAQVSNLERELARALPNYKELFHQVGWQDIQSSLRPQEAVIEFVHFRLESPKSVDSTIYAALLLRPESTGPKLIKLCEAKTLDTLLMPHIERKADYVNNLYTQPDRGISPTEKPKKSLYQLLWQPLGSELKGVKTIYFSASGLIHRLNLGAIPIPSSQDMPDSILSDKIRLIQLNSSRQLLSPKEKGVQNDQAVLYGGIQYDSDGDTLTFSKATESKSPTGRGEMSSSEIDPNLRGGTWQYLKWTEKETQTLASILKTQHLNPTIRSGKLATEEDFKSIGKTRASPKILHIATHGFFFPDVKKKRSEENDPIFKISEHPMIRSGLVLAGGNHAWQNKPVRTGKEDGILTAYEISQMNLSNTELVVLSACETGLGDIQGNEGVYGLQRAFKIAGAKYLIMSLWQVPDFQTQELMVTFYQHWLERKMSIPDAFRAAQKEMREKYQHPYFWAGFVLVE